MTAPTYTDHRDLMYFIDAQGQRQTVRTATEWQHRRRDILANMQKVMGRLPDDSRRVDIDVRIEDQIDADSYIQQRITYRTEPDFPPVPAYLLIPKNIDTPTGAMLCLHPTGNEAGMIPAGLAKDENRHYAKQLAQRGYVCLAPAYPSFGGYEIAFGTCGNVSGTMKAIWDNIRGVDLLEAMDQVDSARVGAIGHSLGGHNAMFTAAFDLRIKAVVSSCGFCSFRHYYGGDLRNWAQDRYMPRVVTEYDASPAKVPFDFEEVVAAIAPRAFFAVSPNSDSNFDHQGVVEVIDSATHVYTLLDANDKLQTLHPNCEHDFPLEARQAAYAFLDNHLRK